MELRDDVKHRLHVARQGLTSLCLHFKFGCEKVNKATHKLCDSLLSLHVLVLAVSRSLTDLLEEVLVEEGGLLLREGARLGNHLCAENANQTLGLLKRFQ